MRRNLVEIDEAKCDGCGECIPSCAEGAIELRGGKARLVSDVLCDGLGACLGECPRGALRVVEREADAFDELAVATRRSAAAPAPRPRLAVLSATPVGAVGCAGSAPRPGATGRPGATATRLANWPVQLGLVDARAPWLAGADLLVAADCVPFAYPDFHRDFLAGRRVVVGCPKLDDLGAHASRLAEVFRRAAPRSVTVVKMEVPCCAGIAAATREALRLSGRPVAYAESTVSVDGVRLS